MYQKKREATPAETSVSQWHVTAGVRTRKLRKLLFRPQSLFLHAAGCIGQNIKGGERVTDGGWRVPDGGWRVPDGGWGVPDGGWRVRTAVG